MRLIYPEAFEFLDVINIEPVGMVIMNDGSARRHASLNFAAEHMLVTNPLLLGTYNTPGGPTIDAQLRGTLGMLAFTYTIGKLKSAAQVGLLR